MVQIAQMIIQAQRGRLGYLGEQVRPRRGSGSSLGLNQKWTEADLDDDWSRDSCRFTYRHTQVQPEQQARRTAASASHNIVGFCNSSSWKK
jgi:hypothetical protein